MTRRRFLTWGLTLPLVSLALTLPTSSFAAAPVPGRKPSLPPEPGRKPRAPRLLVLDPGHGGHDPGAIGGTGLQEKDVTLDIATRMAEALESSPGLKIRLTREDDTFLPLQERVKKGREAGADLFMSVHADHAPNSGARGLSAYTLSAQASDQFAGALADKENRADLLGGVDLSQTDEEVAAILFDLTTRRTRNIAERAKVGFVRAMGRNWRLLESPERAANFAVLRSPDVPSILVETGFLSNPQDETLLGQPKQRQKIAELMAQEISTLMNGPLFS
ncbi:MAG: N-acetylmuramoyl-L-alanine amidase [Alphaproteobacteria bacterium]|nr:N-acetylmuramoyl-L-alanine amidase [Alphaproteobacteria bacterium]